MILFFIISFFASVVGAICGVGGGVIIKPVMDMFQLADISTINFLSCCTVLSMSCYSVGKNLITKEQKVDMHTATPLAIGAVLGGILGKQMFQILRDNFENQSLVGVVQAAGLGFLTLGTLLYTLNKERIKGKSVKHYGVCVIIGLSLGIISSFLGIGGGPINLVVLYFFFGMNTKTAAANSLYIILFSQISSLLSTILAGNVPSFDIISLVLMAIGGILGGMVGRFLNKRMDDQSVDKLFIALMAVIIGISIYNMVNCLVSG